MTIGQRNGGSYGRDSSSSAAMEAKPEAGIRMSAATAAGRGMTPLRTAMMPSAASSSHRTMTARAA
jgi:hypothetical protein